jgi:hypothetical protein
MKTLALRADAHLAITKTPYEQIKCSMDFAQVIGSGGITFLSVTSSNASSGEDTTAAIIATSPIPGVITGTNKIAFLLQGGTNCETHRISIRAKNTMTGEEWEGVALLTLLGPHERMVGGDGI